MDFQQDPFFHHDVKKGGEELVWIIAKTLCRSEMWELMCSLKVTTYTVSDLYFFLVFPIFLLWCRIFFAALRNVKSKKQKLCTNTGLSLPIKGRVCESVTKSCRVTLSLTIKGCVCESVTKSFRVTRYVIQGQWSDNDLNIVIPEPDLYDWTLTLLRWWSIYQPPTFF